MTDIEQYLSENKPQVKDDPTFLLEARRRMESVEGIKSEVDRQRRYGRVVLIVALAVGLAVGILVTLAAFLFPVDLQSAGNGIIDSIRAFLEQWKRYLPIPVALIAITLSLVLSSGNRRVERF